MQGLALIGECRMHEQHQKGAVVSGFGFRGSWVLAFASMTGRGPCQYAFLSQNVSFTVFAMIRRSIVSDQLRR